jgi:hypothetical protein
MCGRLRVGKDFLHVLQHWSVQPCVRPFDAVHMTAGHNALRGSGPDQTPAFDNASTQVGCPDRRIDRLCFTCCSPSQLFTSRRLSGAISFTPQARQVPCIALLPLDVRLQHRPAVSTAPCDLAPAARATNGAPKRRPQCQPSTALTSERTPGPSVVSTGGG